MATKQLNELSSLTEVAADDLVAVYDTSETGSEKLKKYPVQSLKTDLTSMDPSSFGNWVLAKEFSGVSQNVNTLSAIDDIRESSEIMIKWTIESVVSSTYIYLQAGDGDTWDSTTSNYDHAGRYRRTVGRFVKLNKDRYNIITIITNRSHLICGFI